MTQRDPRWEPRTGDVIRRVENNWVVYRVTEGAVSFKRQRQGCTKATFTIDEWRQWARDAQVITRGESNDA